MIDELNGKIDFRRLNIRKWKRRLGFELETKLFDFDCADTSTSSSLLLNHSGSVSTSCSKRDQGRVLQNIMIARHMCLRIASAKAR